MQLKQLLLAGSLTVLAGCGGDKDPTGVEAAVTGTVSFTYTGGGGGTFNVTGTMPSLQTNVGNSNWGAGFRDTPNSGVEVAAARARGAGRYDAFFLFIQRLTVGSASVDVANCDPEADTCETVVLAIDISESDENFDFFCFLETGTMAVTEISTSRVKGSFSGTGSCVSDLGNISAFSVSNGTFDVPLVAQLPQ